MAGANKLFAQLKALFPEQLVPHAEIPMPTGRARGRVNHRKVRAGVLWRRWQMTGSLLPPGKLRPRGPIRPMPSWPAWTPRERARNERLRAARGVAS